MQHFMPQEILEIYKNMLGLENYSTDGRVYNDFVSLIPDKVMMEYPLELIQISLKYFKFFDQHFIDYKHNLIYVRAVKKIYYTLSNINLTSEPELYFNRVVSLLNIFLDSLKEMPEFEVIKLAHNLKHHNYSKILKLKNYSLALLLLQEELGERCEDSSMFASNTSIFNEIYTSMMVSDNISKYREKSTNKVRKKTSNKMRKE